MNDDIKRIGTGARMSEGVCYNGIIWVAGQVGKPGDSVADQTRTCLAEVDRILAAAGTDMLGVVTEDNSDFRMQARQATPIGHTIALQDLAVGDTVIKYGEDIGKIVAPVAKGEHVHTHNLKTKRW
jgi:(2R)-sulfolactate sulfo-lyase subunit alpha